MHTLNDLVTDEDPRGQDNSLQFTVTPPLAM